MPRLGSLYVCLHCGLSEFFQRNDGADNAVSTGWHIVNTPTETLELCEDCYDDYLKMIRAFKLSTPYHMPNRDRQNEFIIHNEERDIDGSEQPTKEQPTLEPADTSAESLAIAETIREAGGDRCQGR